MKDLLLTTALISLIAVVPVHAQTTTDNSTDGTTTTETDTTVDTTTDTTTDAVTDPATDPAAGTSSATDTTTTGAAVTTDTATTASITPPEGYTEYDRTALTSDDLQGATVYDANGESVGEITELVMASTTTGADASADMTANTADTDATADTTGDATGDMVDEPTASTTTDGTAEGDTGASVTVDGQVSHVVLDVGGFLGIGAHTVAVPMDALQVFRDANEDVRVYLPWTQAQLEALPEYSADDPSTLGTMSGATN